MCYSPSFSGSSSAWTRARVSTLFSRRRATHNCFQGFRLPFREFVNEGMASLTGGGVPKAKHRQRDSSNKGHKRPKPTMSARQDRPSSSLGSEDNHHQMTKISLNSLSKLEVKNLKRKLISDLDKVRSLINRANNIVGDFGLGVTETPVPDKKLKTANSGKEGGDKGTVQILKNCNSLLTKLMKHKFGWIFNTPVDAAKHGLHDYHTIVKKPMDLGTVKSKLSKSCYKSPLDFAEDVRLTFNNAKLYNPVGHDVHTMAEFLLKTFEEKWRPLETQYESLNRRQQQAPVSTNVEPLPSQAPIPPTIVENRTLERAESIEKPVEPAALPVYPEKRGEEEASGNRDLTFDEKRRLSEDLQDLPFDKLEAVVQIIKKRNPELAQHDDEIELDIDSLDLQTLWELSRFVTEYKESLSKKSVQEPNALVTGPESPNVTKLGHVASPVRQEVNAGVSSSSNSSSSGSGSCSSDSDIDSSGHGPDVGN